MFRNNNLLKIPYKPCHVTGNPANNPVKASKRKTKKKASGFNPNKFI